MLIDDREIAAKAPQVKSAPKPTNNLKEEKTKCKKVLSVRRLA